MDDATLDGLKTALARSPDNAPLLVLALRAAVARGRAAELWPWLEGRDPGTLAAGEERRLGAAACLAAGRAEAALAWAEDPEPETLLLRARALLALGRLDEGRAAYERAVAANATCEEPALRLALHARVRAFPAGAGDGRPALRVIEPPADAAEDARRLLVPEVERVTFSDVGGLEEVKEQVRRRILLPFQKPSLFQRFKKRVGGGILLYGPPGCGKTLLARATAGECGATFLNVAIHDVLDLYIGESESRLHALFEKARASVPAVLFFDEVEALGGKRQYARESASAKVVSQFLAEMDGFAQGNQGVLVLAATNVPWAVDPAFRRPGRFDRVLFVPPPDRAARERILALHLAGRPCAPEVDARALARDTSGFSGADLRHLAESAADEAIAESLASGGEVAIATRHLRAALAQVRPTTVEWLTTARNYARYANEGGQYDDVLAFLRKHGKE